MNQNDQLSDIVFDPDPAPYGRKFIAGLIDAAIAFGSVWLLAWFAPSVFASLSGSTNGTLLLLLVLFLYRLIFILVLGATIGMLCTRIQYLDADLKPIGLIQKLLAAFLILINGVGYYKK